MLVDPYDDGIDRYVLFHYRYDTDRNERRNIAVSAYDTPEERDMELLRLAREIESGQAAGSVDRAERVSGVVWSAHHFRDSRRSRIEFKALGRGVIIPDFMLKEL